jgi:methylphosphotriester-DNA--protein-cysteine methyltransferase
MGTLCLTLANSSSPTTTSAMIAVQLNCDPTDTGLSFQHTRVTVHCRRFRKMHKRTLARHIRDVLGKTPVSYVQDLRIERAVHLLKTSSSTVDEIAHLMGYADGVTLRTLLRRRLGKGIREIKRA